LIYVPARAGELPWYKPSSCFWSSIASIKGKTTISDHYPELEDFFTDILGLTAPSLEMVVDELKSLAKSNPSKNALKELIFAINLMLAGESDPPRNTIGKLNVLPVNTKDGLKLQSTRHEFAIADRQKLWEAFRKHVSILAFSLEEVRELRPFLRWMNLEGRYLSRTVVERTRHKGYVKCLSERLTKEFRERERARALFRSVKKPCTIILAYLSLL
jgi:hypothetical protein